MTPTEMHDQSGASFARLVGDQDRWVAHPRGRTDPRVSPLTGLALPTVALTDPAALDEVFTTARAAQDRWAATPVKRRVRVLAKLQEVLLDRSESVLDVVQWETGKARRYAYEEVLDVVQNTRFYAKSARQMLRPEKVPGAVPLISTARIHRRPVGVVGVIAPWNYPLALAASDALAALYAGNAVVIKPASRTPLSALVVAAMLEEAGVPTGLFQVVSGPGATIGQALIERSDFMMFTGSTEVGRGIAQACGSRLIGCAAELGGKNASIVLPDAELDKWLPGALHECFASSGQLCVSIERIYVHSDIWDVFVPAFIEAVGALTKARDFEWDTDFGPLVDAAQFGVVNAQVQDAIDKGATVLTGGVPDPALGPTGFAPTVLTDVTEQMRIFSEETFGAAVVVHRWSDLDEVVASANGTAYGLNGSVWSGDHAQARAVAARMRCGSVSINEGYLATWGAVAAPIGGWKQSGIGRRHGREGLLKYTEAQTIADEREGRMTRPRHMSERGWAEMEQVLVRTR